MGWRVMSSSQHLHPAAESMYRFIIRYKRMHAGDSPSRREIMAGVGLPSLSMVQHHLVALEAAGRVTRPGRGNARMIGIPGARWEFEEAGQNKCVSSVDAEPASHEDGIACGESPYRTGGEHG